MSQDRYHPSGNLDEAAIFRTRGFMIPIFGTIGVGRIAVAGAISGVTALLISSTFVAWLFHGYQKLTPATWRPEGPREYALGSGLSLFQGFAFAFLFALLGGGLADQVGHWFPTGLLFGLACFAALVLPTLLSQAIFVNFHRGFVAGLILDSLLTCVACGVICAGLMQHR
jgi:hypothetical protein